MKNNFRNIIVSAGIISLLTIPISCGNKNLEYNPNNLKDQKLEERLKQEEKFKSPKGDYEIPFNIAKNAAIFFGENDSAIKSMTELESDNTRKNQWTYVLIPINEIENPDTGVEFYIKTYPDKKIFSQIIIGWEPYKSNTPLEEQFNELIKVTSLFGDTYLEGSKSTIKLDNNEAIKCKLIGKPGKELIVTINKNRIYEIISNCYSTETGEDRIEPDNSFEKFEKGFKFIK
jgi:hypothetical protein